jgi:outer membrane protein assembly factor BamB
VYRPEGEPPELIFASTAHGVTSVDPATGQVNWEFPAAFPLRVVASPVVAAGLIVDTCGTGGSGRRLAAVRPGSKKKGAEPELAYEIKRAVPYVPTCLAHGGLLFLLAENGTATCVRAATGEQVWQMRLQARFYGSFVWAAGRLYAISRKGDVLVVDAKAGQILARNPLGEPSQATPAIAGGVVYLRTLTHLISIGGPGK